MTPRGDTGRLAIWNDCWPAHRAAYEAWYQTEHLAERLSVPGFRRGRRYEAIDANVGYFTYYETENPGVLTSAPYLDRVNNPTPMTSDVMTNAFTNVSRTICETRFSIGQQRGAFAATLLLDGLPGRDQLATWAGSERRVPLIARLEAWRAVDVSPPQSTEESLRGEDSRIDACLFIETLREDACRQLKEELAELFEVPEDRAQIFHLLCEHSNG